MNAHLVFIYESLMTIVQKFLTLCDFPLGFSICRNSSALSDTLLEAFFKFGILFFLTGLENFFYFSEMSCVYFYLVSLMVIKS